MISFMLIEEVYKRTRKNGCLGDIPNGSPENKKHNESMKSYKLEGLLPFKNIQKNKL